MVESSEKIIIEDVLFFEIYDFEISENRWFGMRRARCIGIETGLKLPFSPFLWPLENY